MIERAAYVNCDFRTLLAEGPRGATGAGALNDARAWNAAPVGFKGLLAGIQSLDVEAPTYRSDRCKNAHPGIAQ